MIVDVITRAPITSPSDLMKWVDHLHGLNSECGPMLFRGQSQVHTNLMPTLGRSVQGGAYEAAVLLERRLIKSFRTHYRDLTNLPSDMPNRSELESKSDVDVLSLMQHYEVPSRLLDWTESAWVAAYFACSSNPDSDAELWFMDSSILNLTPEDLPATEVQHLVSKSFGEMPSDYHPKWGMPLLAIVEPMTNARLKAQSGRLTASDNATIDHAQILWRLANHRHGSNQTADSFGRHIIRAARKRDVLRFLSEEKDISAKSLFPDIVGLGRFLRWEFEALKTEIY